MATTVEDIKGWIEETENTDTHLIVVCDTFDWDDYPIFVRKDEDVFEKINEYDGKNMQQIMEIYDLTKGINRQIKMRRAGLDILAEAREQKEQS